jgi:hypothetical protein
LYLPKALQLFGAQESTIVPLLTVVSNNIFGTHGVPFYHKLLQKQQKELNIAYDMTFYQNEFLQYCVGVL